MGALIFKKIVFANGQRHRPRVVLGVSATSWLMVKAAFSSAKSINGIKEQNKSQHTSATV